MLLDVILSSDRVLDCSQQHFLLLIEHQGWFFFFLIKGYYLSILSTNPFTSLATSQKNNLKNANKNEIKNLKNRGFEILLST